MYLDAYIGILMYLHKVAILILEKEKYFPFLSLIYIFPKENAGEHEQSVPMAVGLHAYLSGHLRRVLGT
jgi:hypothetical protein